MKLFFTKCWSDKSRQKINYLVIKKNVLWLAQRDGHGKNPISSGRTVGCFALIIGREGGNVMGDVVLLHTAAVAE